MPPLVEGPKDPRTQEPEDPSQVSPGKGRGRERGGGGLVQLTRWNQQRTERGLPEMYWTCKYSRFFLIRITSACRKMGLEHLTRLLDFEDDMLSLHHLWSLT